jgi:hypothetical protein
MPKYSGAVLIATMLATGAGYLLCGLLSLFDGDPTWLVFVLLHAGSQAAVLMSLRPWERIQAAAISPRRRQVAAAHAGAVLAVPTCIWLSILMEALLPLGLRRSVSSTLVVFVLSTAAWTFLLLRLIARRNNKVALRTIVGWTAGGGALSVLPTGLMAAVTGEGRGLVVAVILGAFSCLYAFTWSAGVWAMSNYLRRRPVPMGYCPMCGYDLRGLNEMRCPECGWAPTREQY